MATQIEEQKKTDIKDLPVINWDPRKDKKKPVGTGRGDCLYPPCGDKPNVSGKKGKSKDPVAGATKMAPKKPERKPKEPAEKVKLPKPDSKVKTQKAKTVKKKPSDNEKIKELNQLCSDILKDISIVRVLAKHPWYERPINVYALRISKDGKTVATTTFLPPAKEKKPKPEEKTGDTILDLLGKEQRSLKYANSILSDRKVPAYRTFIMTVPDIIGYFYLISQRGQKSSGVEGQMVRLRAKGHSTLTKKETASIVDYLTRNQAKITKLYKEIKTMNEFARQHYFSIEDDHSAKALEIYFNDPTAKENNQWITIPVGETDDEKKQEPKNMSPEDIKKLIKEAFTDRVYGKYPYSHQAGEEGEPKEDYQEQWKSFCLQMVQDKTKERAIAIAKLLIKDIELFEDVLDLAGQNQSIGSEILRKMEDSSKNML